MKRYILIFMLLLFAGFANAGQLVYSTFLGGSASEEPRSIAVDNAGNAYVTGYTNSSTNFPTTAGAFDTTYNGDNRMQGDYLPFIWAPDWNRGQGTNQTLYPSESAIRANIGPDLITGSQYPQRFVGESGEMGKIYAQERRALMEETKNLGLIEGDIYQPFPNPERMGEMGYTPPLRTRQLKEDIQLRFFNKESPEYKFDLEKTYQGIFGGYMPTDRVFAPQGSLKKSTPAIEAFGKKTYEDIEKAYTELEKNKVIVPGQSFQRQLQIFRDIADKVNPWTVNGENYTDQKAYATEEQKNRYKAWQQDITGYLIIKTLKKQIGSMTPEKQREMIETYINRFAPTSSGVGAADMATTDKMTKSLV